MSYFINLLQQLPSGGAMTTLDDHFVTVAGKSFLAGREIVSCWTLELVACRFTVQRSQ